LIIFDDVGFKSRVRFHGQFREEVHVPDVQRRVGAPWSCGGGESASALLGAPWKGTMESRAVETRCEYCTPYGHFGHFKSANFALKRAVIEVVVERYEIISEAFMGASVLHLQDD
jgi:hypothetical protein